MSETYRPRAAGKRQRAASVWFDLDNGDGVAIDDVILRHSQPISI